MQHHTLLPKLDILSDQLLVFLVQVLSTLEICGFMLSELFAAVVLIGYCLPIAHIA